MNRGSDSSAEVPVYRDQALTVESDIALSLNIRRSVGISHYRHAVSFLMGFDPVFRSLGLPTKIDLLKCDYVPGMQRRRNARNAMLCMLDEMMAFMNP